MSFITSAAAIFILMNAAVATPLQPSCGIEQGSTCASSGKAPEDEVSLLQSAVHVHDRHEPAPEFVILEMPETDQYSGLWAFSEPKAISMEAEKACSEEDLQAASKRIKRLDRIQAQSDKPDDQLKTTMAAVDILFPDGSTSKPKGLSSICECQDPSAGNCKTIDDSATSAAIQACESYNNWVTFTWVGEKMGKPFTAPGSVMVNPDIHDFGQGELGNCYLGAAIAAIALTHPEVIRDMFVDKHLWGDKLFKTKWFINGRELTVTVDEKIPGRNVAIENSVSHGGATYSLPDPDKPRFAPEGGGWKVGRDGVICDKCADKVLFFGQPSADGEFWTVILGKAWAKIFGSFARTNGGKAGQVLGAITRAPLWTHDREATSKEEMWTLVKEAEAKKFPMCGSAQAVDKVAQKRIGVPSSHAYVVMGTLQHGTKKGIKMFNPHRKLTYTGAHDQKGVTDAERADGVFAMTLDEFYECFNGIAVARLHSGFTAKSVAIKPDTNAVEEVTIPAISDNAGGNNIYASITWPTTRFEDEPCELKPSLRGGSLTIEGAPKNDPSQKSTNVGVNSGNPVQYGSYNTMAAQIHNLAKGGTYEIKGSATFNADVAKWISDVYISVYGPKGLCFGKDCVTAPEAVAQAPVARSAGAQVAGSTAARQPAAPKTQPSGPSAAAAKAKTQPSRVAKAKTQPSGPSAAAAKAKTQPSGPSPTHTAGLKPASAQEEQPVQGGGDPCEVWEKKCEDKCGAVKGGLYEIECVQRAGRVVASKSVCTCMDEGTKIENAKRAAAAKTQPPTAAASGRTGLKPAGPSRPAAKNPARAGLKPAGSSRPAAKKPAARRVQQPASQGAACAAATYEGPGAEGLRACCRKYCKGQLPTLTCNKRSCKTEGEPMECECTGR